MTAIPDKFVPSRSYAPEKEELWVARHPGAAITIGLLLISGIQWVGVKVMDDLQRDERNRAQKTIERLETDISVLANYSVESSRANRVILEAMAHKIGIPYTRQPELEEAEAEVRKLNRDVRHPR